VFRYRLRTLLIVLALAPPVLAGVWFAWPHLLGPALAMSGSVIAGLLWAGLYWYFQRQ
jgi:hypothetical protein